MNEYKRYPPDPPARRNIWLLIIDLIALLVLNVAHQTGMG